MKKVSNIFKVIWIIFEIISILALSIVTAYRITRVTESMILDQWKISLFWTVIAFLASIIFFVVDKYVFKIDIDGEKFKIEMIAYTVIYVIVLAIFAYMDSKDIFTAVVAPIIFTPTIIVAILAACGGGAIAEKTPDINIKTNEVYDQWGNYKGRSTTYTGLGGVKHSYYTDRAGNIKGESTTVGNTTITKINK